MQRIGSEGSHGSNLVWRPLKGAGATLRALPFKHRFFCCRENNPQHRYNIKVAKHNTERLNFKSGHLHVEVNECQQWGCVFVLRLSVLVRLRAVKGVSAFQGSCTSREWVKYASRSLHTHTPIATEPGEGKNTECRDSSLIKLKEQVCLALL